MAGDVPPDSKRILAKRLMGPREFVEREWLEREQRIARYCAGRMSAVDEAAFEAELIGDTELASDVQMAMVLRDALQDSAATASPRAAAAQPWRSPWLALAAGIFVGVVGLTIVRGQVGSEQVFADVEFMNLGTVRSAEPQIPTALSRVGEHSLLIIEVPAEQSTLQIELIRPDGRHQVLDGTRDQGYLRIALAPPVDTGSYVAISGKVRYAFNVESRAQ